MLGSDLKTFTANNLFGDLHLQLIVNHTIILILICFLIFVAIMHA